MLTRLFSPLLPPSGTSRRPSLVWVLALLLSPVAYVASTLIILRTDPNAQPRFHLDRAGAVRTAAAYAHTLGIETSNWTSGVKAKVDNDLYYFYLKHEGEEVTRARRLAPAAALDVLFISPDRRTSLGVELSAEGRPLGYALKEQSSAEVKDYGEEAARALAVATFRDWQGREGLPPAGEPVLAEERKASGVTRRYTWKLALDPLPAIEQRVTFTVAGERVIAQNASTSFDPAYARREFVNRRLPARLSLIPYGLFLFGLACYGLYRYIRRAMQKEVPHARSLLLGVITSIAFTVIAFQSDFYVFAPPTGENIAGLYWIILITTMLVFIVYGMALGLAYGSGEGDVREAYPGKLTSLDAPLSGRLLARNVARAVCVGAAFGGWALLARALVALPWARHPAEGLGLSDHFYGIFFGQSSWLLPILNPQLGALQTSVVGLLLPLSLLLRSRLRSRRLLIALLAVLAFVAELGVFQEQSFPFVAGLLTAALRAAVLLLLFFAFDLLTAMVGVAVPSLVVFILYFVSQPVPSLQRAGLIAAGLALGFLALQVYILFRGREYREEEVRPLYARYQAERLDLQAEVSAAREAQVRLMPQRLPEMRGLHLAASCRPARVVGGDFYDLFVLDEHRLGIFVAEGGGHGLGAALTIAFAKGFLMPRAAAGHTPAQIICHLQEKIAAVQGEAQELALAYAVIDVSRRTLTYARAGRYPQVRVNRPETGVSRHDFRPAEREVNVSLWTNSKTSGVVREAELELQPGDAVLIVTDGIVENLKADRAAPVEEWALKIMLEKERRPQVTLQEALDEALERRARRTKKTGVEDDLTAVLIRLERNGVTA